MSDVEVMTAEELKFFIPLNKKYHVCLRNAREGKTNGEAWTSMDEQIFRPLYRKQQRIKKRKYRDVLRQRTYGARRRHA
jgi:hypothetical protein